MKEGKLEKIKKTDKIEAFIKDKVEKSKDDLNPSPLRMVKREDLIPEVEKIFNSYYVEGDILKARGQVDDVNKKIEDIKNSNVKNSNEQFFRSFDHLIIGGVDIGETKEFNQQDNT